MTWPYSTDTLTIPFPVESDMNDYRYVEEAIASAELGDRDLVEPVAVGDDGWNEERVGTARVIMHMPGSKKYDNFDCLDRIDARVFAPNKDTYVPFPHVELVNEIKWGISRYLEPAGINTVSELCILGKGKNRESGATEVGAKMFGVIGLNLVSGENADDARCVIGFQNALDASGRVLVGGGSQIFICDNMAFNAEMMASHRHTKNVIKNVFGAIHDIIRRIPEQFSKDQELHSRLRDTSCRRELALQILSDLVSLDAFDNMKQFKSAVKHYNFPEFSVFANDDSMWPVYNAVTWGIKQQASPLGVIGSTSTVNDYFREKVGLVTC